MVLTIINSTLTIINVHYPKIWDLWNFDSHHVFGRPGPSQFDHFPSTEAKVLMAELLCSFVKSIYLSLLNSTLWLVVLE